LNTSKSIIELFMFLFKTIEGYYPSIQTREPSVGGLTNINIENCHKSYVARSVINPDNLLANDYQVVRIHEKELQSIEVETYDIEVDCPTHSFIANNVIVHNSACLTRVKAGVGIPQLSAVLDCVSTGENIISDGGHKTASDVCKALAAGAKAVMIGGMFAGTEECPGEIITTEAGKKFKKYRGSASEESYQVQGKASKWRAAEGDSFLVEYKGPVEGILLDIEGGIRSSMTYVDSKSLDEYVEKAQMVRVSASTVAENGAHGKK
jgi:IMP dehydrogenase/GMP reductase